MKKIALHLFRNLVFLIFVSLVAALVIGVLAKLLGWIFVPSGLPFMATTRWTFYVLVVVWICIYIRDVVVRRSHLRKDAVRLGIDFDLAVDAWTMKIFPCRYRDQESFLAAYRISDTVRSVMSRIS